MNISQVASDITKFTGVDVRFVTSLLHRIKHDEEPNQKLIFSLIKKNGHIQFKAKEYCEKLDFSEWTPPKNGGRGPAFKIKSTQELIDEAYEKGYQEGFTEGFTINPKTKKKK